MCFPCLEDYEPVPLEVDMYVFIKPDLASRNHDLLGGYLPPLTLCRVIALCPDGKTAQVQYHKGKSYKGSFKLWYLNPRENYYGGYIHQENVVLANVSNLLSYVWFSFTLFINKF